MGKIRETAKNLPVAVLALLISIVFFPVVHFGFVNWDDTENFIHNPWVKSLSSLSHWIWPWKSRLLAVYQPIAWIFVQLQYALSPTSPAPFIHVFSLLLHIANSVIVFTLCVRLSKSSGTATKAAAFCGALYFALHPLQCETIAWASAQPYLLATFWGGLSLLCFLKSLGERENPAWYRISIVLFAASLLSKSVFVSFPAILAIVRFAEGRQEKADFNILLRDWLFWAMSLCSVGLSLWARAGHSAAGATSWVKVFELAPAYFGFFVDKMALPVGLSPVYPQTLITPVLILLGLSLFGGTAFFLAEPRSRPLGMLLLALIVLLLPGVAAAMTEKNLFADRYAYLPNAVIGVILCAVVYRLGQRRKQSLLPSWACALFLTLALGVPSRNQAALWSDSSTLWEHSVQTGGALHPFAHNNLGLTLEREGKKEEAIRHYQRAIELDPDFADAHNSLGSALAGRGQTDAAIAHYQRSLELNPGNAETHNNLGNALGGRGLIKEAIEQYQKALELNPDFADAHNNLAIALAGRGQLDEAVFHYEKALQINPDYPEAHNNFANALASQGRIGEAIAEYQKALLLRPEYVDAENNIGVALARQGKVDEAIAHYRKALEIRPDIAEIHNSLGAALVDKGRLDEAIAQYQKALEIDPNHLRAHQNLELAKKMQENARQPAGH